VLKPLVRLNILFKSQFRTASNLWKSKRLLLAIVLSGANAFIALPALAAETIKVEGVLHSLSGTMAISETNAEDTRLDDGR